MELNTPIGATEVMSKLRRIRETMFSRVSGGGERAKKEGKHYNGYPAFTPGAKMAKQIAKGRLTINHPR